ncbi:uncharacterized protein BT62DRAFT_928105 [Guyanagaster necrorhizus]|uniref:Sm domain-containing protein n=1 Tax=Guyanagaster necrorhizus TaxID=856835 RepID=A0A9P7W253_9AGAR|nr:uncharacterized protein BT62DRAFT_928105 [Guyanagaster necrorhizus MCA 3950]KAG7450818.1 hypothetical protein BT62DRAFT_928105 [Guyanagaster necrorhizus MCA 3950]
MSTNITALESLFRRILRVTVTDGRVFIGSFAGTDKPLNILLVNTEEFRIGVDENPDGRFVGQIMISWHLVVKVEVYREDASHLETTEYNDEDRYT